MVWFNGPVTPLTIFVKTRLRNVQAGALSRGSVLFHRKSTSHPPTLSFVSCARCIALGGPGVSRHDMGAHQGAVQLARGASVISSCSCSNSSRRVSISSSGSSSSSSSSTQSNSSRSSWSSLVRELACSDDGAGGGRAGESRRPAKPSLVA